MSEPRHAYLILAHHRPDLLSELLAALDDPRNDIFVHIDAKSGSEMDSEHFACEHAKLVFTDRIPVNWGGYSQVKAEILLLGAALAAGVHERYHLLTGASYPLKSQDEIYAYCAARPEHEIIGENPCFDEDRVQRIQLFNEIGREYYPMPAYERGKHRLLLGIRKAVSDLQALLGGRHADRLGIRLRKGLAYWSLTQEAAAHVYSKRDLADRLFRHAIGSDEFFVQTLLANGLLAERMEGRSEKDSLRWTTWDAEDGGVPRPGHNLTMEDLGPMLASDCLFALKFEGPAGPTLINAVKAFIEAGPASDPPSSL